jgi:hypothetical protein
MFVAESSPGGVGALTQLRPLHTRCGQREASFGNFRRALVFMIQASMPSDIGLGDRAIHFFGQCAIVALTYMVPIKDTAPGLC